MVIADGLARIWREVIDNNFDLKGRSLHLYSNAMDYVNIANNA